MRRQLIDMDGLAVRRPNGSSRTLSTALLIMSLQVSLFLLHLTIPYRSDISAALSSGSCRKHLGRHHRAALIEYLLGDFISFKVQSKAQEGQNSLAADQCGAAPFAGKKKRYCIVAVNGPTWFFQGLDTPCTHARTHACMLRNYCALHSAAYVGTQSDALTRAHISPVDAHRREKSDTLAEGLMGLRLQAGKWVFFFVLSFSAVTAADDDVQLQLLLFTRAFSFHGRHAPRIWPAPGAI